MYARTSLVLKNDPNYVNADVSTLKYKFEAS